MIARFSERPEAQREVGERRRERHEQCQRDDRGDERADGADRQRRPGPALRAIW